MTCPLCAAATETLIDSESEQKAARMRTRKTWLLRFAIAVAVVGAIWFAYYMLVGRNHITTDNAYVNAEMAQVTPLISAQVTEVLVEDTDTVKRGDILAKLDPTNAEIAVAQAEADLATAQRAFRQAKATSGALSAQVQARGADIAQARARLASAQAEFEKARVDLQRRQALRESGAVSGDELTSAQRAYAATQAAVAETRAGNTTASSQRGAAAGELAANQALVEGATIETDPAVMAAKARLRSAKLDLERTVIRAPIDGVVTKRDVQVGQRVQQGTPIMSIVPLDQVYVDANFKEGELQRVRVGMPATVTADIYGGDVVYTGRVAGFSGATGSALSLIPAQNATGNWIKVVQRLPIRIELDEKQLAKHPLRVGLSTEVDIDLTAE